MKPTPQAYFEDFGEGEEIITRGRTISRADVVQFAGVSGDFDPLHVDTEFGKRSIFGKNVAHGLCVLSVASGLIGGTGIFSNLMAFYGMEDWKFRGPLFFGDTIRVRIRVLKRKESSKPDRGNVRLSIDILNQRDEVLQQGIWNLLVRKKGSE